MGNDIVVRSNTEYLTYIASTSENPGKISHRISADKALYEFENIE